MTIHLDDNSDAVGEIEALKKLLKENKGFLPKNFTNKEIVAIALNELYDRLVAEKKAGAKQRRLPL